MYLVFSAGLIFSPPPPPEFPTFSACHSTTKETQVVEMRIWSIKIGIVLVLHFNPWFKASAGGLAVRPLGSLHPSSYVLQYMLKNTNMNIKTVQNKVNFINPSQNEGLSPSSVRGITENSYEKSN
jgi:hypothetical protein